MTSDMTKLADAAVDLRRAEAPRGLPHPRRDASTASRSCISTTRTRPRSHGRSSTRSITYYRHDNANIHRATHLLSERATAAYEGTRATCARSSTPPTRARSSSPRAAPRASTSSRRRWGRTNAAPGRRGARHLDGAPLEHRSVAARVRADGRDAEGLPHHGSRRAGPRRLRSAADAADEAGRDDPRAATRSAPSTPSPSSRARRRPPAPWCSWTVRRPSPHLPVDVQAIGCDFYAFSGHKIYGPDGHRRALRQARRCSRRCRPTRAAAT